MPESSHADATIEIEHNNHRRLHGEIEDVTVVTAEQPQVEMPVAVPIMYTLPEETEQVAQQSNVKDYSTAQEEVDT